MMSDGLRLIVLGFFKKVVLADNLAAPVERYFSDPGSYSNLDALGAAWMFAFQIYLDFSAYTDIARGIAKMMGFELAINFRQPYLAASIADFWHRWHITLSTFFRDYVFIPLGGSRGGRFRLGMNILIVFGLSGLWHGAAATFVLWGLYHGCGYLVERALLRWVAPARAGWAAAGRMLGWLATLTFVVIGWILFRAESFADLRTIFGGFLTAGKWQVAEIPVITENVWLYAATFAFLSAEALLSGSGRLAIGAMPVNVRRAASLAAVLAIVWLGNAQTVAFIYFKF